jgi:chromate transporter
MNDDEATLWALATNFVVVSFMAVGGVNAVLPEIHRRVVDVHGWMPTERFTDLFAIAQAAPGPNLIVVTLLGWEIAGTAGALVATLAIAGPTSVIAYFVGQIWHRYRFARWRIAIQSGITPITIGLVAASGFVLARATDSGLVAAAITLGTALAMTFTRIHPFVYLAIGGAVGSAGFL